MDVNARCMDVTATAAAMLVPAAIGGIRGARIATRHPDPLVDGTAAMVVADHTCGVVAAAAVVGHGGGGSKSAERESEGKSCEKKFSFHRGS